MPPEEASPVPAVLSGLPAGRGGTPQGRLILAHDSTAATYLYTTRVLHILSWSPRFSESKPAMI